MLDYIEQLMQQNNLTIPSTPNAMDSPLSILKSDLNPPESLLDSRDVFMSN